MSDVRFPYLKNFLKPTRGVGAKSAKNPSAEFSALLAPGGLVRPGKIFSSGEGDTGGLLEEFQHGEVSPKLPQEQDSQTQNPRERVLTCFECPLHEHDTVNPSQGWGRCTLKKRGCYGLRPACEAAFDFPDVEKYCASPWCRYYRPKQYPGGDKNDGLCEHPALDHDRENFNEELVKLRGEKRSRYAREKQPDWIPNMKRCPKKLSNNDL